MTMNLDESNFLARRVSDLEGELRALRQRVAALEGREAAGDSPTRLDVQPLQTVPLDVPPLESTPAASAPVTTAAPQNTPAVSPPIPTPSASAAGPVSPVPVHAAPAAGASPVSAPAAASMQSPEPAPAVPASVQPGAAAAATDQAPASSLRDLLAAVQLLPPSGQAAGEAGIGAWWATRIGALILVIGIVFFGVYVSLSTPPWVRLLELAVIAGGVTLGGLWIERRLERLGSVVMGAGLALCYFTTFAAYAVPPVKVVESVGVAALLQAAAVVGIGGVALWRRASTVGTMAVLLGFTSAFFSLSAGFDDFAVAAGLGLSAMAVFFRHRERWGAPVLVSGALVHVLIAIIAVEVWSTEMGHRGAVVAFAVVLAAWGLHFLSAVLEGAGEDGRIATVQRWLQAVNTPLAVMAGFAVALEVVPRDRLSWYFFGAGAVLLGAASWAWRAVPRDGVFGMFAVKAASLVALGVIVEWDARTRWVALAVQAAVIMAAAVRTQRVSLAAASVVAWLVSLLFFGEDVELLAGRFVSGSGIAVGLYLVGSGALLGGIDRWLRASDAAKPEHNGLTWMLGGAAALPVLMAVSVASREPWLIVACVTFSVVQLVVARVLRTAAPMVGGVVAMLAAHALVQVFDETTAGRAWLWVGAGLVALRSVFLGWHAGARRDGAIALWRLAGGILVMLALAAVSGALMQSIDLRPALACGSLLALGVVLAGAHLGREDLRGAGLAGFPVIWALHVAHQFGPSGAGDPAWLWVAAAAVPAALAVPRTDALSNASGAALRFFAAAAGVILVWAAAGETWETTGLAWSLVLAAATYLWISRWRACTASSLAASALLLTGAWRFLVDTHGWARGPDAWTALVPVFLLLAALGMAPLVQARRGAGLRPPLERLWRVGHAIAAIAGFVVLATVGYAAWSAYGSVVWALGGIGLFLIGLRFRARSHRLAGLVALGACIPRVFTHDIESTQYRIAAFVVLGILLLIVGFSYQRFRHLIDVNGEKGAAPRSDSAADLKRPGA